jgi:hypothetical protein
VPSADEIGAAFERFLAEREEPGEIQDEAGDEVADDPRDDQE